MTDDNVIQLPPSPDEAMCAFRESLREAERDLGELPAGLELDRPMFDQLKKAVASHVERPEQVQVLVIDGVVVIPKPLPGEA